MGVKVTIPNTGSDYLTFGSANTADAAKVGGYEDSTGNGHLELYTTASGTSTERMRIDSSGNVGIGTSSPACQLQVRGNGATLGRMLIRATDTGTGYGGIQFEDSTTTFANTVAAVGNAMAFSTGGSERMRIDSSGNVGIGTSSPTANVKLDVVSTGTRGYIKVEATSTTGTEAGFRIKTPARDWYLYNNYDASGALVTYDGTAGAERMRIDSSGNLLVGTTSQITTAGFSPKLNVVGSASGSGTNTALFKGSAGGWTVLGIQVAANGDSGVSFLNSSGSGSGGIFVNTSTTTYATSSDYRLKENIQPMQNALNVVAQLNPVTYTWKADGSDGQGFIAHELQAVVPDCVTGEKDAVDADGNSVYQGIDTSFLVATLTKAIQEQQAQIETLTAKVAALEAK